MSGDERQVDFSDQNDRCLLSLPQTFAEAIAWIKTLALQNFAQEIKSKQLYYHNYEHIQTVQRRSHLIFRAVYPALAVNQSINLTRTRLLLDLCVVAHDMVQVFTHSSQQHTARRRDAGVSETATIEQLAQSIQQLNLQLDQNSPARFTEADIDIIREAIEATICVYDPLDQAIYQPRLYGEQSLSIVARILALADLGALGIDGIGIYNEEGSLLFLEENLDVVSFFLDGSISQLERTNPTLCENIRQRFLRRSRFQVSFAKSRLARFHQEIQGFPADAMLVLTQEVFKHLIPDVVQTVEATTPTAEDASLTDLLKFFQFESALDRSQFA